MIDPRYDSNFVGIPYDEQKGKKGIVSQASLVFCQIMQQIKEWHASIRSIKSPLTRLSSVICIPKTILDGINLLRFLSVSDLFFSAKKVHEQFFETLSLRVDQGAFFILCFEESAKGLSACRNIVQGLSSFGKNFNALVTNLTWLAQIFGFAKVFSLFDTAKLFEKEYAFYLELKTYSENLVDFGTWVQENEESMYETCALSRTLYLKNRCQYELDALYTMLHTHITKRLLIRTLQLLVKTVEVSIAIFACIMCAPLCVGIHKTARAVDTLSATTLEIFVDTSASWHRKAHVQTITFLFQRAFQCAKDLDDAVKKIKMPCISKRRC